MRIDPIVPDTAVARPGAAPKASGFAALLDAARSVLDTADGAEAAFARGTGGLQEMVVARARADITLSVAAAGAQHAAQALNAILGMQI